MVLKYFIISCPVITICTSCCWSNKQCISIAWFSQFILAASLKCTNVYDFPLEANYVLSEVQTEVLYTINFQPVLSERNPRFDSPSVHVRFEEGKLSVGQVFLLAVTFPAVSIIPPMIHSRTHPNNRLVRDRSGRSQRTIKQSSVLLRYREALQRNEFSFFFNL
jgi:hypothetical protein